MSVIFPELAQQRAHRAWMLLGEQQLRARHVDDAAHPAEVAAQPFERAGGIEGGIGVAPDHLRRKLRFAQPRRQRDHLIAVFQRRAESTQQLGAFLCRRDRTEVGLCDLGVSHSRFS